MKKLISSVVAIMLISATLASPACADDETMWKVIGGLKVLSALSKMSNNNNSNTLEYTEETALQTATQTADYYANMTKNMDPKVALQEYLKYYQEQGGTASISPDILNSDKEILKTAFGDTEQYELAVDYAKRSITVKVTYPKVNISEKVTKGY